MRPILAVLSLATVAFGADPLLLHPQDDEAAIREVIESAYVDGVFVTRDEVAVRAGFHPDFVLSVLDDGGLLVVTLDEWLERLGLDGNPSGEEVRHEIERIDVTGYAGLVRLHLWIDGERVYTDHMALYRFPEGWRIVQKTFFGHE